MVTGKKKPAEMPKGYFGWSLLDGEKGFGLLRSSLHNLSIRENAGNHAYGKGLLVGIVSALMAGGMEFDDVCQLVWQAMPSDTHPDRVPEDWHVKFKDKLCKSK